MPRDKEYETYGIEDNLMIAILIIVVIILIIWFLFISGQFKFQIIKSFRLI